MRVAFLLSLLLLCACPPNENNKKELTPAGCTKVGQSCEFSPGKLGTCVLKENCTSSTCFVCQSQH